MIPYQEIIVDLLPVSVPPRIRLNASQYDKGRPIKAILQYDGKAYTLPAGAAAYVDVRKPSGKIVHDAATVTAGSSGSSVVTFDLTSQMTAEYGQVLMELSIVGDDQDPIGTANWIMLVEMSPLHAGDPSETWVVDLNQAVQDAEDARDEAQTAQAAAETAQGLAEDAQRASETAQGLAEAAQRGAEAAQGLAEAAQAAAEHAQEKAEAAEDAAEDAADRAEQSAAVAGYMFFHIDENGHLIYEHTVTVDVEFYLYNGHLYVGVSE